MIIAIVGSYVICVIILLTEAEMWEITKIVIPNIKAEWEDLAYCMRYKPGDVEGIKQDSRDVQECCRKLFTNWLATDHGPKPKTYQTLLKHIKKVDNLAAAYEVIEKELIQGNRNLNIVPNPYTIN